VIPDEQPIPAIVLSSSTDLNHCRRISQGTKERKVDGMTHGKRLPRTCPLSPVRGVAKAAGHRTRLPYAIMPDVPFCAAGWMAMAVAPTRCSALGERHEITESGCADIPRRSQTLQSPAKVMWAGEAHPATFLLARLSCARSVTLMATQVRR